MTDRMRVMTMPMADETRPKAIVTAMTPRTIARTTFTAFMFNLQTFNRQRLPMLHCMGNFRAFQATLGLIQDFGRKMGTFDGLSSVTPIGLGQITSGTLSSCLCLSFDSSVCPTLHLRSTMRSLQTGSFGSCKTSVSESGGWTKP